MSAYCDEPSAQLSIVKIEASKAIVSSFYLSMYLM
jgi:hypothetical protein